MFSLQQVIGIEVLGMELDRQVPQHNIQRIKAKLLMFSASTDVICNHYDAGKGVRLTTLFCCYL